MAKMKPSWPDATDYTDTINQVLSGSYFQHHDFHTHTPIRHKYNVIGDRVEEVKTLVVHEFSMGDVEDPDLFAAEPLWKWEQSEQGQWIMKNACDTPTWNRYADPSTYGYKYQIKAKLVGPALTEWLLRYGSR